MKKSPVSPELYTKRAESIKKTSIPPVFSWKLKKIAVTFRRETKSDKFAVQPVFITTKGLAEGMYSQSISFDVTLDDLFEVIVS
ncbi:MAG: hypothetical protein IIU03_06335 [Bacteroidales bacterium]|nr:hypothetical protein [Bacteroidales bacterium]MBR4678518.1 hypothetical protein [Bacteroidales bacterium]